MNQICRISKEAFLVDQAEQEFIARVSPNFAGKTYPLPIPTIAPEERQRRRLNFRNLRHLHRRSCDFSGQSIISMYSTDTPHTVYHNDVWWSDKWEALSYGRDFDFQRPFFEQVAELYRDVPTLHQYVILSENCEFINGAANCKNCYLSFNMDYCEDCYYLTDAMHCRSCVDCLAMNNCELCYQCVNCENCYELFYSDRCINCRDSYFLNDCRRCINCIACSNLSDKQYYVFNKRVSPEEFRAIRDSLKTRTTLEQFKAKAAQHAKTFARRHYFGHSNETFSGDEIHHIKNSFDCFFSNELENCRYCNYVFHAANCYDYNIFGDHSEWIYQCLATGINCTNDLLCMGVWGGTSNCLYCITVFSCTHCLACCGLRQKQYCIFNKQYSKEEYECLAPKIIEHMRQTGEWGEFFPPSMSPFAFQQTVAGEEFPLPREEALRRGYHWEDSLKKSPQPGVKQILPETIAEVDEAICKSTLSCEANGSQYKIVTQELSFYKKLQIPLPNLCPEERHRLRLAKRTKRKLCTRPCNSCAVTLQTTVEAPNAVLCENCYQQAVE